ncbi:MAG: pteridine reductase [Legionellaceae bacterium]|nr:pteridine reductase [Legionellaceae bacterium]
MLPLSALITGSARRVGAAIATHLHQAGFRVVIHCNHSIKDAEALACLLNKKRKNSAHVLPADLTIKEISNQLIEDTINWAGRLDVLVNNASVFSRNEDDWDLMFDTNVKAPFWLSQMAYSHLAQVQGSIINITDIHAVAPLKGYSVYCQTKAALLMQTKALAIEFAPHVRVNAVAPGATMWPEHDNSLSTEQQRKIIARTPLQRQGDSLCIAKAVFSLIDNLFITGQTLNVDGGRSIGNN